MTTGDRRHPMRIFFKNQNTSVKAEPEQASKNRIDYSKEPAGQAAVTMYCLSALQHFEGMELDEIQKVGFEIGLLGQRGD